MEIKKNKFISRKFKNLENNDIEIFDNILNNNLSIILGEPASGKTFQLKNHSFNNKNILFKELVNIKLEEINIDNIEIVFLDSIDEALRDVSSQSMKQLQDKLTNYIDRCKEINSNIKFVLTCRQLEWNEYFANSIKKIDDKLKIYKILDLEKDQIDSILTYKGIDNSEFWDFISSNYLEFLLKNILITFRIIDNYGIYKNKKINYTEIYIDIIKEYLSVKGDDRDELIEDKSLSEMIDISSSLATYMILNKKTSISATELIKLSDELYFVNNNNITVNDLKILLNSSLLDKNENGFVFFHKSIQEFLMAFFINKKNLNLQEIKKLFSHELKFYEEFEEVIVYLTNLNDIFFDEIVKFDTLIFKRHPSLDEKQQEKLLSTMLYNLQHEKSIIYGKWEYFDNNSLLNFKQVCNIHKIIEKNIDINNVDNVLFPYLMKLLHFNYSKELENIIFDILERFNDLRKIEDEHNKDGYTNEDIIKGNIKTRELIKHSFVDNFIINKKLYDFMLHNNLLNINVNKIEMISFELELFESLYGLVYTNKYGRYSNNKEVLHNPTGYSFKKLLPLLDSISYYDLKYIIPYLTKDDICIWFDYINKQDEINNKISLWAVYGLLLHTNNKETMDLIFKYISKPTIYLHIEDRDIEDMPFKFEKIADIFWEIYFKFDIDNYFYVIRSMIKILQIKLKDVIDVTEKYSIEKYTKYYVPFRLTKDIDKFLMSNNCFEKHMNNIWEQQQELQKKWDEEFRKNKKEIETPEPTETLKRMIEAKEVYEESKKSLKTFNDIYNVFIFESMYEQENEHKIDITFNQEQKKQLLSFAESNLKNDTKILEFKNNVNTSYFTLGFTPLYIYYLTKLDIDDLMKYVNTKEIYEKIYWHIFKCKKMNEVFFMHLTQKYFNYFIELFTETISLSLEQSNNTNIISLEKFLTLIEKLGKLNKDNLNKIIKLINSLEPKKFIKIESYRQKELLKVLSLDINMYSYIHSLMEYDNFKSSKYLKTLIIINKNKTISSYMILYLKEKKYNMKSFKEIFKEWTKFNIYKINDFKVNLLSLLIKSLNNNLYDIDKKHLKVIISDYYELIYEDEKDFSYTSQFINNLWNDMSSTSYYIDLLEDINTSKNQKLNDIAKHILNKAYNQRQKDKTQSNSFYKEIFDNREELEKNLTNNGVFINGNVYGNIEFTK